MCKSCHSSCNDTKDNTRDDTGDEVSENSRVLPTRLLRIGLLPGSTDMLCLEETDKMDENIEYLAFSHCWGLPKMKHEPFRLLQGNYKACQEGIDLLDLCQNMQDALNITRRLGYQYMWIDSLCIIQDSASDWEFESRRMANVYSGAACTIAATASDSGDGGCFHDRVTSALNPVKIGVSSFNDSSDSGCIYIRRDDAFDFERHIDRAPLNKRGWVFQERLLSRRILHFGADMMYWECRQRSASEITPDGYIYKKYPDDFKDYYVPPLEGIYTRDQLENAEREARGASWSGEEGIRLRPPPPANDPDDTQAVDQAGWLSRRRLWKDIRKMSSEPWINDEKQSSGFRAAFDRILDGEVSGTVGMSSFSYNWYEIIETYTRGELSHAEDKLVAMSAITQEVQKATGYTFVAGLWKETISTNLLWFVVGGNGRRLYIDVDSRDGTHGQGNGLTSETIPICPTWSWASLEGTVGIDLVPDNSTKGLRIKSSLAEVRSISAKCLHPKGDSSAVPQQGPLIILGRLCMVSKKTISGSVWQVRIGDKPSTLAWVLPDLASDFEDTDDWSDLFCVPILEFERSRNTDFDYGVTCEIRGLVLRKTSKPPSNQSNFSFERVGIFTTAALKLSQKNRVAFLGEQITAEIL